MKKTLLPLFILFTIISFAQTPLPYYTGFDDTAEQAGWTEFRKGEAGLYQWHYNSFQSISPPNSLSHNYPVGGSNFTEDWFVSPAFDFSGGGTIDSFRYKFSGFGTPRPEDSVAIYLLTGSNDPDLATSMIMLKDYRDAEYQNDDVWRTETGIVIPPVTGTSYIAFKYYTDVNWLDVRFDNLYISGNPTGIKERRTVQFDIFPNPAKSSIKIAIPEEGTSTVQITDITGKVMHTATMHGSELLIPLTGIKSGIYLVNVFADKSIYTGRFVMQE